jgi:hypothetical protein
MKLSDFLFNEPAPMRRLLREAIKRLRLGSYRFRYSIGALDRPNYAYLLYQAAQLAARLGQDRISVIEFGVAGGNGLRAMERHAERIEKLFPVRIEVYGFDTGEGLPAPEDHRDIPYHWQPGFFRMDQEQLKRKLTRAKLILGNVRETWAEFAKLDPAPIAAVSHDLDFYSSTMDALKLFELGPERLMPRVFCYFDDTFGTEMALCSEFSGQRLAIEDFNRAHEERKIGIPYYLRLKQMMGSWVNQIWILHVFDSPDYNRFVSTEDQQLPLNDGG